MTSHPTQALRSVTGVTKRSSRGNRHTQLLTTLAELVATQGAEELSLPELAARAGVSVSLVYRHFPSRAAALRELLEQVWHAPEPSGVDDDAWDPADLLAHYLHSPHSDGRLVEMLVLRPSSLPEVEAARREIRGRDVSRLEHYLLSHGADPDAASIAAVLLDAALVEGAVSVLGGGDHEAVSRVLMNALRSAVHAAGAA
jgi:AcrR family transcriptional regulator